MKEALPPTAAFGPNPNPYDAVSYQTVAYTRSHPRWLATLARLFGLNAPDPRQARILELGCGNGGNIIPMAAALPDAQLHGIDLSAEAIALGVRSVNDIGLQNLTLRAGDILDRSIITGHFDYIIAHGLFSWVPENVQKRILEIMGEHLTEHGVAFISYNTLPGWRIRGLARDAGYIVAQSCTSPQEAATKAKEWYSILAQSIRSEDGDNTLLISQELERQMRLPDWYLLHDTLEENNHPVYFTNLVNRAANYQLQFLTEADLAKGLAHEFHPSVAAYLQKYGEDRLIYEQMLDFLRLRMLRNSLLCRTSNHIHRSPDPWALINMSIASSLRCQANVTQLLSSEAITFKSPRNGGAIQTREPHLKAILHYLGTIWPQMCTIQQLLPILAAPPYRLPTPTMEEMLPSLMKIVQVGLVETAIYSPPLATSVSTKPRAFSAARALANYNPEVPSLRHESIGLQPLQRTVLKLCNGATSIQEIATSLARPLGEIEEICRLLTELALLEKVRESNGLLNT